MVSSSFRIRVSERIKGIIMHKNIPSTVRVGISPMDIKLSKQKPEAHDIEAKIYTIEPIGDGLILTLKVGEELIRVESVEELELKPADTIWWKPEEEKLHIFNRSTGLSLI
jgi:ABC-type sugar transport system ATPase subunit